MILWYYMILWYGYVMVDGYVMVRLTSVILPEGLLS